MSRTPEEFVQSRHGACRPKEGSPNWCATHGSMKQIEVCNYVLDLADEIESYAEEVRADAKAEALAEMARENQAATRTAAHIEALRADSDRRSAEEKRKRGRGK